MTRSTLAANIAAEARRLDAAAYPTRADRVRSFAVYVTSRTANVVESGETLTPNELRVVMAALEWLSTGGDLPDALAPVTILDAAREHARRASLRDFAVPAELCPILLCTRPVEVGLQTCGACHEAVSP